MDKIVIKGARENNLKNIDIAGERPSIESTSGLFEFPKNCLAYADRLSTYLLSPSA